MGSARAANIGLGSGGDLEITGPHQQKSAGAEPLTRKKACSGGGRGSSLPSFSTSSISLLLKVDQRLHRLQGSCRGCRAPGR